MLTKNSFHDSSVALGVGGKAVLCALLLFASAIASADVANTATQQVCKQVGTDAAPIAPTPNPVWAAGGLNRALDRVVYKQEIVAYKIKWSGKAGWSDWYVKGVNDLDWKTPGSAAPNVNARLVWVYFTDHHHQYIACF